MFPRVVVLGHRLAHSPRHGAKAVTEQMNARSQRWKFFAMPNHVSPAKSCNSVNLFRSPTDPSTILHKRPLLLRQSADRVAPRESHRESPTPQTLSSASEHRRRDSYQYRSSSAS